MKGYIERNRGILAIMTLVVSITFLGTLTEYKVNSFYADICEEELLYIIEPQSIKDEKNV